MSWRENDVSKTGFTKVPAQMSIWNVFLEFLQFCSCCTQDFLNQQSSSAGLGSSAVVLSKYFWRALQTSHHPFESTFLSDLSNCVFKVVGFFFSSSPLRQSLSVSLPLKLLRCPPDLLRDIECTKPREICDAISHCLQQRNPPFGFSEGQILQRGASSIYCHRK